MLANRYRIESVIGRGGMGVVYKAHQEMMDKKMAIKMLHSHLVAQPEAVQRFSREAKTVSQVRHHHIVTLYDFGIAQNQPYLVMDYLEGTSLKDVIKNDGPMPFDRAERIYQQVFDALAHAHKMDLVHRDLKPENIMLTRYNNEDDWVTLVDFGLSKLKEQKPQEDSYQITKVGDVCGSPPYMSPEQCLSSQVVDPRSDIYSLAICVYESLTGKLPFNVKSAIEMLDCHLYATPIPFCQAIPDYKMCTEVTTVFNKALQKEPDKRHQTVEEFAKDFNEALRRDSVKLKAYRHRQQTSEFQDLASEAEALSRQLYDSGTMQALPANEQLLDGVQFVQEQPKLQSSESRAPKQRTDRKMLETGTGLLEKMQKGLSNMVSADNGGPKYEWTHCPYCDTPAEAGVRFCLNCKHQFISPEAAAKLKLAQEANYDSGPRGFSKKAKEATANGAALQPVHLAIATGALLIVIAVVGMVSYANGTLGKYIPGLQSPHIDSVTGSESGSDQATTDSTTTNDDPSEQATSDGTGAHKNGAASGHSNNSRRKAQSANGNMRNSTH
jgi:serine/threonine protein kinase